MKPLTKRLAGASAVSGLALAALLSAMPVQAALFDALTGKNQPVEVNPDAPLTVADFVKVNGSGRLAGITRVAIPNFFVQFVRDQTIERSGRLGSDSYTTQVRGMDAAALQALADGLYDGLVAELRTAGIEVVPTNTLETDADFQELRKAGRASPYTLESSTGGGPRNERMQGVSLLVSARQLPINVRHVIDKYWLVPDAADGFKVSLVTAPVKLSQSLKLPLLDVRYTVAFATLKGAVRNSGTAYSAVQSTSFQFDADFFPRLVEGGTMISLIKEGGTPGSHSSFTLTKPVVLKDLSAKVEKGDTGARGSGLLGALGRAVGGSASMAADAYLDLPAADLVPKLQARGQELSRLMVEAMLK